MPYLLKSKGAEVQNWYPETRSVICAKNANRFQSRRGQGMMIFRSCSFASDELFSAALSAISDYLRSRLWAHSGTGRTWMREPGLASLSTSSRPLDPRKLALHVVLEEVQLSSSQLVFQVLLRWAKVGISYLQKLAIQLICAFLPSCVGACARSGSELFVGCREILLRIR